MSMTGTAMVVLETSGNAPLLVVNILLFSGLVFEAVYRVKQRRRKVLKNPWDGLLFVVLIAWAPVYKDPLYGMRALILVRCSEYAMVILHADTV